MKKFILFAVPLVLFGLVSLLIAGEAEQILKKKGIHVADLTLADEVNLKLSRLEQAFQQKWVEEILLGFYSLFSIGGYDFLSHRFRKSFQI